VHVEQHHVKRGRNRIDIQAFDELDRLFSIFHDVERAGDALLTQDLPYEQHIRQIVFRQKDVQHRNVVIHPDCPLVWRQLLYTG